jgi:oligopeptide/dipeptide ABC transporter ATP-binding protein
MTAPLVRVRDLEVRYPTSAHGRKGPSTFAAISGIDLDVGANEIVGIVGESGSGKSTLGRAIAGLQAPAAGRVTIREQDVWSLDARQMRAFRQDVQFVFQDPYSSLNPRWSVADAIERPLRLHSDLDAAGRKRRVAELLQDVGLTPQAAARFPSEMSGGQRQRVAIARALASNPSVIIADEPTASLDVSIQAQILALLQRLVREHGLTLLLITHDFGAIRAVAERVVVMHLGEIVESAPIDTLLHRPLHPYTQALLSAVPSTAHDPADRLRLQGPPLNAVDPPSGCRLHPRCPVAREDCATVVQTLTAPEAERLVRCAYATDPATARWTPPKQETPA